MAKYVSGLNHEILRWAREKAGYSLAQVADALKKDPQAIADWEAGLSSPTYSQLEKLAYQLYRRPLALFFFPEPPVEPDVNESFRTLPEFELASLAPHTRYLIRQAQAMQLALYELTDGRNPAERIIFRDLRLYPDADVVEAAKALRSYLGITLSEQSDWQSTDTALRTWREAIQHVGVFVFKQAFKQDDVSGFCLLDIEFPIIYLNNSTAKSRQIFSLFHELAHVLLDVGGITRLDDTYIATLSGEPRAVEVFCNRLAAEFLVPSGSFDQRLKGQGSLTGMVEELADEFSVSREVILRRLLDRGIVNEQQYDDMRQKWILDYRERRSTRSPGGDYYRTQGTYLGAAFLNLAFSRYYEGRVSIQELADYLNVKVKSVPGIEEYAFAGGRP